MGDTERVQTELVAIQPDLFKKGCIVHLPHPSSGSCRWVCSYGSSNPVMSVAPSGSECVTVTMPSELVAGTDPYESNSIRSIAEAVNQELRRRRPLEFVRSLDSPHPESLALAAMRLQAWGDALPDGDL